MKKLILIRHGKSAWDEPLADHERPLKKRGFDDGELVSSAFKEYLDQPVTIISSYANRALTTARIFQKNLSVGEDDFHVIDDLYTFDGGSLLKTIKAQPDQIDTLMVFGHNPAMTSIVNQLGDEFTPNVPTTGLTVIEFDTNRWKEVSNGKTLLTLYPKFLR
ncbi:phosphohistidine phosphatase SixA [Gangjinia marincola]|uniref:Phosphohistidine phosphatase SixA n=1 Tax=Gangjinia marincola TaxID=578463 RepID=A0ABP3XT40_9FLAO